MQPNIPASPRPGSAALLRFDRNMRRRIAEQALAARQWEESQRALEMLLRKSPSDLDGHFLRGRLHLAKGESTEAIQDFQTVLKIEPGLAVVRVAQHHKARESGPGA